MQNFSDFGVIGSAAHVEAAARRRASFAHMHTGSVPTDYCLDEKMAESIHLLFVEAKEDARFAPKSNPFVEAAPAPQKSIQSKATPVKIEYVNICTCESSTNLFYLTILFVCVASVVFIFTQFYIKKK